MNWWKIAYTTALLTGVFVVDDDDNNIQQVTALIAATPRPMRHSRSIAFIEQQQSASERISQTYSNRHRYTYNSRDTTTSSSGRTKELFVGSTGWDNDNFLDALSKGSDALEKANEEYRLQSRFANMRPASDDDVDENALVENTGAVGTGGQLRYGGGDDDDDVAGITNVDLSKDQIERIKKQNDDESSGSGEMFKKMLERAQQGSILKSTMQPPQSTTTTTMTTDAAAPAALPEGFEKLSVEAQAALFRQLMATPQREQWPAAPGPRPEAKGQAMIAADGRKIGRNKDADSLVNTSDVYFAQLKLDSAVRNQARREGDVDKAEAVFADPTIPDLKLHVNPYLEEQRKKELEMIETTADEMFSPELLGELKKEVNLNDRGVSYKEMLEQRRKVAQQQQSGNSNTETVPATPPRTMESPFEVTTSAGTAPIQSIVTLPPPPPLQTSIGSASTKTEDDTRRDIRTLMGLLIKHRGGPGFGAGRIVGTEMERFATLSSELMPLLRSEGNQISTASSTIAASARVTSVPMPSMGQAPVTLVGDRMNGVLACIEGAITMYKNSPPELQQSVVMTLRAALLSALNACNEILAIQEVEEFSTYQASANDRINSVLTCIEGAITMYKNSPPELQHGILVTLRVALLSAVAACNEIMDAAEIKEYEAYRPIPTDLSDPNGNPTQYNNVASEYSESLAYSASASSVTEELRTERTDESAVFLESVYQKLKDAAGDGKMGLRQDLSAMEAEELADDISRMRALLVDELNGSSIQREPSSQPPAAAQYKQMLAKVRADKDAAGNN